MNEKFFALFIKEFFNFGRQGIIVGYLIEKRNAFLIKSRERIWRKREGDCVVLLRVLEWILFEKDEE